MLALISRVRGFAEGSELVLRQQQQALQRQQTAGLFSLDQDDDDAQYLFTQKGQTAQNRQQYRECDEALVRCLRRRFLLFGAFVVAMTAVEQQ